MPKLEKVTTGYLAPDHVLDREGIDMDELMEDSSSVPACCEKGCYVESDGTCPHGHPSVLLALRLV